MFVSKHKYVYEYVCILCVRSYSNGGRRMGQWSMGVIIVFVCMCASAAYVCVVCARRGMRTAGQERSETVYRRTGSCSSLLTHTQDNTFHLLTHKTVHMKQQKARGASSISVLVYDGSYVLNTTIFLALTCTPTSLVDQHGRLPLTEFDTMSQIIRRHVAAETNDSSGWWERKSRWV